MSTARLPAAAGKLWRQTDIGVRFPSLSDHRHSKCLVEALCVVEQHPRRDSRLGLMPIGVALEIDVLVLQGAP